MTNMKDTTNMKNMKNMKKIRLLCISPYNGMNEILQEIASSRNDIELDCHVADLDDAVTLINHLQTESYDAIISRGGTATLLQTHTHIPIIDSGISSLDVLRAIRLAENFSDSFSIVGFENITAHAKLLIELMEHPISVYTIANAEESRSKLIELKDKGILFIVCDTVTSRIANTLGLCSILITSGYESLQNALEQAILSARRNQIYKDDFLLMSAAFRNNPEKCLIFDMNGELLHSSLSAKKDEQDILLYLKNHFHALIADQPDGYMEKKINNTFFKLYFCRVFIKTVSYIIIYINIIPIIQTLGHSQGLRIISRDDVDETDINYYLSTHSSSNILEPLKKYSRSNSSVIIIGENGTGKDKTANYIYSINKENQKFYYVIDCDIVSKKEWNFLIEHENSPLANNGHFIYFRHITNLNNETYFKLLRYIADTNMGIRNRLIFSVVLSSEAGLSERILKLQQATACVLLNLLPLRERKDDIPRLCTMYINRFNPLSGKQIIGFDSRAIAAMQSFPWPDNLDQFKRIIHEAMILTTGSFISYEHTMFLLRQETPVKHSDSAEYLGQLDLNKTLEQITYDIINLVLLQENGNHTNTAKRLGISRSTLWRILKSSD